MEHKHIKPTDLYLKMLQIGAKCIHCGVTYQEVKTKLCQDECLDEPEMDTFLHYWFDKVYIHNDDCKIGKITNYKDYIDKHLKVCQHYMNSDAVTQLHNFETAKTDKWLNRIAIGLAVLSLGFSLFLEKCTTSKSEKILSNIENLISNNTINQTKQIDQIKLELNLLQKQKSQDSMFYTNILHNTKLQMVSKSK